MTQHENTVQNTKSRSEKGQNPISDLVLIRGLSKSNEGYWKPRLRKRSYRYGGHVHELPDWHVKLAKDGVQRWVNLETPNAVAAAKKARDTWELLCRDGWGSVVASKRGRIESPTIGAFLDAVRGLGILTPRTFNIYSGKLRRIVAGVFGITGGVERFGYQKGGNLKWRERVHFTKLQRLTPVAVKRWGDSYLKQFADNPVREAKAKTTLNSLLRAGRALFAEKIVKELPHLALPMPLPFDGVKPPRVRVKAYVSKVDPTALFALAQVELANPDDALLAGWREGPLRLAERTRRRQMFLAFCLGLFAGLRRDEIDTLTWRQIDFERGTISVEVTEHGRVKSEASVRVVDIDAGLVDILRRAKHAGWGEFVIARKTAAKPSETRYSHYRCDRLFDRLVAWLKLKGVEESKALHAMRKEFGSQINLEHGLFAASAALGHASIQLTKSVYVAKKSRAVFRVPTGEGQQ